MGRVELVPLLVMCLQMVVRVRGGMELVGPGALATRGSGGGRRSQGFGYVNNWPSGFFIAGSSIYEANGLYVKSETDSKVPHASLLTYTNKRSGWSMLYNNAEDEGYGAVGGAATEWLMVDGNMRDRFGHKGGTYIPGAGNSWSHLHRAVHTAPAGFQVGDVVTMRKGLAEFWEEGERARVVKVHAIAEHKDSPYVIEMEGTGKTFQTQSWRMSLVPTREEGDEEESAALSRSPEDDLDELPWQVVAVMSDDRMEDFVRQEEAYHQTVKEARAGTGLPHPAPGSDEKQPPEEFTYPTLGEDMCMAGNLLGALEKFKEELVATTQRWRRAVVFVRRSECKRLHRQLGSALADLDAALAIYPQYAAALFGKARVLLDTAQSTRALRAFETLLRVDRSWPRLQDWIVRAHASARRSGRAPVSEDVFVGDRVRMARRAPGLWEAGDTAVVVGLGTSQGPVTIRLDKSLRTVHTQPFYLQPLREGLPPGPNQGSGGMTSEPTVAGSGMSDHYHTLGVACDFTPEQLRQAYRTASRTHHPDKGGSAAMFQSVAVAHEVLSDPDQRQAYDEGADLPSSGVQEEGLSLREQVERRYFPDHRGFWLFGDPLEKRRENQARQAEIDALKRRAEKFKEDERAGRTEL